MFYDGGFYMGGVHGLWWFFLAVLIAVPVYSVWGASRQARRQAA